MWCIESTETNRLVESAEETIVSSDGAYEGSTPRLDLKDGITEV